MPVDYIQGKDVVIVVLIGGFYRQVACYTTVSLAVTNENIETTSKESGNWRYYRKTVSTWAATAEGIQFLDTVLRFDDMRKIGINGTPLTMMFTKVSISGTRQSTWMGRVLVERDSESGAVDEPAPYTLNLKGNGELQADFDPVSLEAEIEMWYYYTCDGTEGYSITFPELIGYMPSGRMFRDTRQYDPSGTLTTGRPATDPPDHNQYRWDATTGTIYFDTDDAPLATGEHITIPNVALFTGCSLYIDGFTASVSSNGFFYLQWNGTGIPANQLLFQYSTDNGTTKQNAQVNVDPSQLNNATSTENLDTSVPRIWYITPVCINGAKGATTSAFWSTVIIHIVNTTTGGDSTIITVVNYTTSSGVNSNSISAVNSDNMQRTTVYGNQPAQGASQAFVAIQINPGNLTAVMTVTDMNDVIISGSVAVNTGARTATIPNGLPNEFKIKIQ